MILLKIIKYKKIKNKYRVFFEDESFIDLYDDVILRHSLLLKKRADENELEIIKEENKKEDLYYICIKYISIKMRSKNEIISYLKRKEYSNDDIDMVIKKLEDNNMINDEEYVKAFIVDKFNLTSYGPNKIKRDLINEEFDILLVDKYIDNISKEDLYNKLDKLIDKKILSLKKYSGEILKYKIMTYFINLGYDKSIIEQVLSNKNLTNNDQGMKEYEKLYNKYSKKYEGYELENILKQKLYQKGFDYNEIKRNIN